MRVDVRHREGRRWRRTDTLHSDGRAHFEYAQRAPVPGASCSSNELPRRGRAHRHRPARRHRPLHDPPRRRVGGPVRVAEPRPAHRRRPRRGRGEPRAGRGPGGRAAGRGAPGARDRRRRGGRRQPRRRRAGHGRRSRAARAGRRLRAGRPRRAGGRRRRARRLARAAGGIVAEAVRALRDLGGPRASPPRSGPATGPAATRSATSCARPSAPAGARSTSRASPPRQLDAAGVADVHDVGLCTACATRDGEPLFFSHRRDGGVTGRQAGVAWRS